MTLAVPHLRRWCAALILAGLACAADACGGGKPDEAPKATTAPPPVSLAAPRPEPAPARPRIVALGDSLTAGLGLPQEAAYPALLQQRLDAEGLAYEVVNAGVSGDTSAGGLSRLDWALDGDVRVLIVALGGNDALRGLPVDELRRNLSAIVERARAGKIKVLLAGMEAPPNYGRSYIVAFHQVYADLAARPDVTFVPFLLEGVAGIAALNQRDGIHPTAEGARIVADTMWRALRPML
jgi:acyl-CoA thioesterase-1